MNEFAFVVFIIVALMYYEKIYTLQYDFWQETKKILKSLILAYFIVLALLTLTKTSFGYSRLFISIYFLFAVFLMPIAKRFEKRIIYKFPFFKKKVLVMGDNNQVEVLKKELRDNWYIGMESDDKEYDTVIISSQGMSVEEVNHKITKYLEANTAVYIVPYVTNINFANSNIMEYSNIRYSTIQVENKLLLKINIWIKNLFDLFVTLMIMPFFLLIHAVISLAIILDSKGAVFFKQDRLGKDDNNFVCYKYRTMYKNADDILKNYLKSNPDEVKYYEEYHKYKNDPRVTKIGRLLRTTSMDELPQIINVLKGEMSLVGPRPYMLNESDKLGEDKNFILKVKPGITGLWQVSGRNNLTFKQRNELEVWYIKNWSLWADFVILIKTVKVVFSKIGAK
ncbi:exopolysaccharide biosynthesis polyprenyl glycosylphosphotransferase [Sulfurimonas autotrophica]|uniref:exopolysaccharide biosynthesis polyprenyl glycosylphosphotransferase n=1 Tax=Sulfurimonas autotrophica TaxID=202747 RepID=UPI001FDFA517|nr:exopolysaccharide biosynthesis polyprenyl glycosylphosphotransferase [Sulfurimonas autotrophica]